MKKKVGFYVKFVAEMGEGFNTKSSTLSTLVRRMIEKESVAIKEKYGKKGLRLMDRKVREGQDGDDFAQNVRTVVVQWFSYKKPRFIK